MNTEAEPLALVPDPAAWARRLAGTPLLAGFDPAECLRLTALLDGLRFRPGERVIAEGAVDRSMYFCIEGNAVVRRGDVELQRVGPGEHFGELGLIAGTPRAASVIALNELTLARLAHERYAELHAREPALGRRLLEAVTASLAVRLTDVTDNMRQLLRERSLPRRAVIEVEVDGQQKRVHPGTPVRLLLPSEIAGERIVAALIDQQPVSLAATVSSRCKLAPLSTAHWEGHRIYRHSLGLLALEAAQRLIGGASAELGPSLGHAQRVYLPSLPNTSSADLAKALEAEMRKIAASNVPLLEEFWTIAEAREMFLERRLGAAAELLATWREPTLPLVSYGEVYALGLGPLVADSGLLTDFAIEHDENGLLLVPGEREKEKGGKPEPELASRRPPSGLPAAFSVRDLAPTQDDRFLRTLAVTSVGAFNRTCLDGSVTQLIRVHEGLHEKAIGQIADTIAGKSEALKIVCVAGPSSSGKTTFIKRLRVQLQVNAIHPIGFSLDDYYLDRERCPRDEHGEYDFETLDALDVPLLRSHLTRLMNGETVKTARYDFRLGKSEPEGGPEITLGPRTMLLLEGIHGINPAILGDTPREGAFRIFVCPLTQLPFDQLSRVHSSDLRLLRRIVRDRHHRATKAEPNILRWPSVRRGERKHIYPFQGEADAVFDSSLAYEPAVLKVYAERYLLEVPHDSAAYATAYRLLRMLDRFVTIYPDQVPPTSLLREFIGGSGFEY